MRPAGGGGGVECLKEAYCLSQVNMRPLGGGGRDIREEWSFFYSSF